MKIIEHPDYPKLSGEQTAVLYESAKKNLRVGFEIEMYSDCPGGNTEPEEVNGILEDIGATFVSRYGFVMAVQISRSPYPREFCTVL